MYIFKHILYKKAIPFYHNVAIQPCLWYKLSKERAKNRQLSMDVLQGFIIITVAGLIHASFQLGVSALTLLSSHTIGRKRSHMQLLRLSGSFVVGVAIMTLLLLSFLSLILLQLHPDNSPSLTLWSAASGLAVGIGIAIWLFYYRRQNGTSLWLPRSFAKHLHDRTKATRHSTEAFSLGLVSGIAELVFTIAPLLITALILLELPTLWQLAGLALYTLLASLSVIATALLVGGGHSLGRIQKWREQHKLFLQFIAGSALMALGFYLYVEQITMTLAKSSGVF